MRRWRVFLGFDAWVTQVAGLIVGLTTIIGGVLKVSRWANHQKAIGEKILAEFAPNGGSSLRDSINRIEALQFTSLRMTGKAYWVSKADGTAEYISPALAAIMGGSQEQFTRNGWIGAVPTECRQRVVDDWNSSVKDNREFDCEYAYLHPNGTLVRVHGHALPMTAKQSDGTFKVIGYLGWVEVLS